MQISEHSENSSVDQEESMEEKPTLLVNPNRTINANSIMLEEIKESVELSSSSS